MNGLVLIDKKEGMSSYDVIKIIKRKFNSKKVGHCGTLDPFASGLLIVGVNQATKVMNFLEHDFKEYEFKIKLGTLTDTYDLTGKVLQEKEILKFTKQDILKVLNEFKGEITQTPPIYSSIHVNGKHLYEYARNNEEVNIPTRKVFIYDLNLITFTKDEIFLKVKCSRGTYVRSLGVDIAFKLNQVGHLSYLRRLSIGKNKVDNAYCLEQLLNEQIILTPIEKALSFKKIDIKDQRCLKKIYNGQEIRLDEKDEKVLLMDGNNAIAIYQKMENNYYHCLRGLYDEEIRFKRLNELS